MRITTEELAALRTACADRNNGKAQELVNLLGTASADEMVRLVASLPMDVQQDLEKHVREALDEQRIRLRRR